MLNRTVQSSFFFFILAISAICQPATPHHYLFGVTHVGNETRWKELTEALRAWEGSVEFDLFEADDLVDLRINTGIVRAQFAAHLNTSGFGISSWSEIDPANAKLRTIVAIAGYPKYMDTGDHAADNARYDQAKQVWMNGHPQEYRQMNLQPH